MTKDHLPIPDRLIVLTFDDGVKSHATFVAPLPKDYGFNATFYITEGLNFLQDKDRYMTWEEVRKLDGAGFEIGNHTRHHKDVSTQSREDLIADLAHIDRRCQEQGIPLPQTFCYPGYSNCPDAVDVLAERQFFFARRGMAPEYPYRNEGGRGPAYNPTQHHPLLIPTTGAAGPDWTYDDFIWAVEQARDGNITVLTFHGVPDLDHPWVDIEPDTFKTYMDYLDDHDCTVIAVRELAQYVTPFTAIKN